MLTEIKSLNFWNAEATIWNGRHPLMDSRDPTDENSYPPESESLFRVTRQLNSLLSQPGKRGLNLACGARGLIPYLFAARAIEHTVDADLSPEMLASRNRNYPQPENTIQADLNSRLPFKDGEFDGILCYFGLRYALNPEAAFGEMLRVVLSGGVIQCIDFRETPGYPTAVSAFIPEMMVDRYRTNLLAVSIDELYPEVVELGVYRGPLVGLTVRVG